MNFKKLFLNWRVIILILFLLFAITAIRPGFEAEGVAIRSVVKDSAASEAGIVNPKPTAPPKSREVIEAINGLSIKTIEDYENAISDLEPNTTLTIITDRSRYTLLTKYKYEPTNETEDITVEETIEEEINGTIVEITHNVTKEVPILEPVGMEKIGLNVYPAPLTNIRKGLDLQGGTRILLQPEEILSDEDLNTLLDNMKQRLNVFGLTDLTIRSAEDLPEYLGGTGKQFIIVEIAGVSEDEVRKLVSSQGKFEAKISNKTVFVGGKDITYVCRTADCSGIDPQIGCRPSEGGVSCGFAFSISLLPEAAKRAANITSQLEVVGQGQNAYLSEQLELYLDDELVDALNIGVSLKGQVVTEIQISGSGIGITQEEAITDALANMKQLQTVLITGSLPVKLQIEKVDTISPLLGEEFIKNSILVGILTILAVGVMISARYRKPAIVLPMIIAMVSEVILLLGFASIVGWNLDLAAIAGIIIVVGTSVDHLIIITDELLSGEEHYYSGLAQKVKRAFFIIMVAFFTTTAAMLPLVFAGAGLLKGFALTTIVGIALGVFITRPAYAAMIQILLKE